MAKRELRGGIGRLEAFSDAVLAIVLTLLVLDLLPKSAQSPAQLLGDWPTYLAFLAAFLTIGITWLNHNQSISRVSTANPVVLVLNLGILLGATLVPWPTALVAAALQRGNRADQFAAIVVFAVVTVVISIPWLALDLYLVRHPHLLESADDAKWMLGHARISVGTIVGGALSIVIAIWSPLAALLLYLIVSAVFVAVALRERVVGKQSSGA